MIYSNIAEYEEGDSKLAIQTILDLHKEIERLNNIINKAIEYIENHSITNIEWWITGQQKVECKFMEDTNPQELLEILKGEDKE